MKVCLLIIATGKYTQFLEKLISSADRYFLKEQDVTFFVFTDDIGKAESAIATHIDIPIRFLQIENAPWPHATLYRFHFFQKHKHEIADFDYYFYIDVDCEIKARIGNEVIGERTGTRHCGFMMHRGSYEQNQASIAYVSGNEGVNYFAGGFWGFSNKEFWEFIGWAKNAVDNDQIRSITPEHNDEAYLNRYFIDNPPTKKLTPSYHYPESDHDYYMKRWPHDYHCIILLLDKNHDEVRGIDKVLEIE